jgi:16S rRNA (cytidine1402-2'-O)-methyltransferase
MASVLGPDRRITIAREITKTFETIYCCALRDAEVWLKADANQQRGEFVLLVEAATIKNVGEVSEEAVRILKLLLVDLPLKQAVKLAVEITNEKKNILYDFALQLKQL